MSLRSKKHSMEFGAFSALPRDFQNERGDGFKDKVLEVVDGQGYKFLLDCGQSLYDAMRPIVEQEAAGNESSQVCQNQTASFENYTSVFHPDFFKETMESGTQGNINLKFNKHRIVALTQLMGKSWSDPQALGVATAEGLAELQQQTLLDDMQGFVQSFIKAMRTSLVPENPTADQQYWTTVLYTAELNRIVQGRDVHLDWLSEPWTNPAVKLWVEMLSTFEASGEAAGADFIDNLVSALSSVTSPKDNKRNVQQAISNFENLWHEVAASFDTKEALVEWLCTRLAICIAPPLLVNFAAVLAWLVVALTIHWSAWPVLVTIVSKSIGFHWLLLVLITQPEILLRRHGLQLVNAQALVAQVGLQVLHPGAPVRVIAHSVEHARGEDVLQRWCLPVADDLPIDANELVEP
mmetsp:Transcript_31518/g.49342  ORF Transcript_31518/g.49342 Transcript_31518/m.49342 type:complete len:408 (+) Transcript_31518:158-1381(+)